MGKIKSGMCFFMAVIIALFPVTYAYSQEPIAPGVAAAGGEVAAIAKDTPYVKPGNVSVNFKNADIRAVLRYLSEVSGVDIVPAPDVTGAVTLSLTDKPWEVALEIIVKNYGYAYEREGGIIRVVTVSSLNLEELSTEVVPLNYATAESAQEAVKDMLTERGKLTYDERMNALVVTDLATNIYKIKKIISDLDKKTPQIMIEAKIIETVLSDTERLGIDWNLVIAASGAARPTTIPFANIPFNEILPHALERFFPLGQTGTSDVASDTGVVTTSTISDFPSKYAEGTIRMPYVSADLFAFGTLDFSQFSAVLEYIKLRADTDIISNPRITTLNNKTAKMFVGKVYNYISEVEQKEASSGSERWTYKIDKEEIGIRLLVTPHINESGDIEIELKPEIKDVVGFQQITQFFSLPIFTTREAETQVMVRDGNTIFIGGLIKEDIKQSEKKVPFFGELLGDLPFIGGLFKHKSQIKQKTELVFFLTVHVVRDLQEFNALGTKGLTGLKVPPGTIQYTEEKPVTNEVMVELGPPIAAKKPRPLFDFRKRKKR